MDLGTHVAYNPYRQVKEKRLQKSFSGYKTDISVFIFSSNTRLCMQCHNEDTHEAD